MKRTAWLLAVLGLVACSDPELDETVDGGDIDHPNPDPDPDPDGGVTDPDGGTNPDPFTPPTPFAVPLSAAGTDQLQSAVDGPGGTFYAAGFAQQTLAGARLVTVVKLTAQGLDTSFGGGTGIVTTDVEFRGGAGEIAIARQSTGKLLVSATTVNANNANDRDVVVLRLNADGTPDTDFGDQGKRVVDLSTAHDNAGTLTAFDGARGLAVDGQDRIYVLAVQRGEGTATAGGPRTDTDFAVFRLSADGTLDTNYAGSDGKYLLDIQEVNATPRGLRVLADGTVLGGGYTTSPSFGGAQPVLFKLLPDGEPDPDFASSGVFFDAVLTTQTEIYNFALHGTHLVTGGYGRESGTTNDWVSLRFDVETGERDTAWGGAPNGAVMVDPSGTKLGSNCRNAIALPNGKTALIGSTGPSNQPTQDAALAILDADGKLDTTFGTGVMVFPLGSNGNDQFWGGAVSNERLLLVGYKGGGQTPTDTVNDDAWAVVLDLTGN